ncbi:MAG: PEPxxWA-CTERM sorting domain-containing protein [Sphingomonas sp.]|nr:PEPxxWA-CTERM sorting domain-containing protein [Sphingomonas sp.]
MPSPERGGIMSLFRVFTFACAATIVAFTSGSTAHSQAVPAAVGAPAPAGTYQFDINNGSIFALGSVTTDSAGHATSIYGLVNGTDPITGLSTYAGADNNLYSTGAWVTFGGLSFSSMSLGDFNFYNSGQGYYGFLSSRKDTNGFADGVVATAHVAAVPEPTTWAMMMLGFAAVGGVMRRQKRSTKLAQLA